MKYLVLQSERSINFVVFNGPGYYLTVTGERSAVPFYVRQYVNHQSGTISINQVYNYSGGSSFILTNSGCNISVDGHLIPQGVSIMEEGKKFIVTNLTMFLIDEEEKADIEAHFYMRNHLEEDERHSPAVPSPDIEDDYGFCMLSCDEN